MSIAAQAAARRFVFLAVNAAPVPDEGKIVFYDEVLQRDLSQTAGFDFPPGGSLIELTNNYYVSPLRPVSDEPDRVQGSDVEQKNERATASAGSLNNLH